MRQNKSRFVVLSFAVIGFFLFCASQNINAQTPEEKPASESQNQTDDKDAPVCVIGKEEFDKRMKEARSQGYISGDDGRQLSGVIEGGVLNGNMIKKPAAQYPDEAREAGQQGTVVVQILVDEAGKVIAARAVSGPPALLKVSEEAACQARLSPTLLSGQPVKITGAVTYNFVLQ